MQLKIIFNILILSTLIYIQAHAQKGKLRLCIHDNIKQSPSSELTYYWWDPYHLHFSDKVIDPDGVKKDFYLKSEPPYDYCFFLKPGKQAFNIVSIFNDSISFDFDLNKDTVINFQEKVKGFYSIASNGEKLLSDLKQGDKITVHISKFFNYEFDGLRIDIIVDEKGNAIVTAVNRTAVDLEKKPINYKRFYEAFNEIESAASLLGSPAETDYIVTIRKNNRVFEYKGKKESAKLGQVFGNLKSSLNVNKD